MSQPEIRCDNSFDSISLCPALARSLQADRGKGLSIQYIVNMRTGQRSRAMIVLRSGEFTKSGITLNHCPFCGENISPEIPASKEAANDAALSE